MTDTARLSIDVCYLPYFVTSKIDSFFGFLVEDEDLVCLQGVLDILSGNIHLIVSIDNGTDHGVLRSSVLGNDAHIAAHDFHIAQCAVHGAFGIQVEALGTDADVHILVGAVHGHNGFLTDEQLVSFGYEKKDILCIMFYMCYKLTEAFCDVLHGIDQKNYRMDYVGISYIARGIVSVVVFAVAILITSNIIIAIVAMALSGLIIAVLYDVPQASCFGSVKPSFDKKNLFSLLGECLPAVIASMAFIAIASIPRQVLEAMYDKDTLGYYGTIAAPLVVVQVIATSIFNPMLTELSHHYKNGEIRKFVMRLAKNLIMLVVIASVVCVGVALLGEFAVGLVFGQKFVPYTYLMYGIIGCTTMYVISWLCTSTLIIMRKLKVCAVASIVALGIAILLARPFINIFDMNGVSFSIIVAYITHAVVCSVVIIKVLMFKGKRKMSYTSSDHTYALCAYKESAYLEECVKSLLEQTVKSTIFIATSTPNDHINAVAEKYNIPVYVNYGEKGIGGDWNFAYDKAQTPLVTIAHQDDIYEPTYTEKMLEYFDEEQFAKAHLPICVI